MSGQEERPPTLVEAVPGSALAEQLARYSDLKARADEAKAAYEECTAAIKVLAHEAGLAIDPATQKVAIHDPAGLAPPLSLTWSPGGVRIDSDRLKRDHPGFWETYSKTSAGSWGLRASGGRS